MISDVSFNPSLNLKKQNLVKNRKNLKTVLFKGLPIEHGKSGKDLFKGDIFEKSHFLQADSSCSVRFGFDYKAFMQKVGEKSRDKNQAVPRELSMDEYIALMDKKAWQHLRTTCQYIADAMDYCIVGKGKELGEEVNRYALPKPEWYPKEYHDLGAVGKDLILTRFHKALRTFAVQPHPDKFLALSGPFGSGKNTIAEMLMRMVEVYSKDLSGKGARYTTSWKLSGSEEKSVTSDSYSNPIFVLPPEDRYRLIQELIKEGKIEDINERYFINPNDNGLDHISQQNLHNLMDKYDGDFDKIKEHIRAKLFEYNIDLGKGLIMVGTKNSPDDQLVAGKKDVDSGIDIPEGLFSSADGGIIVLDEFPSNLPRYEHLITTSEKGKLPVGNAYKTRHLPFDALILALGNDADIRAIQQDKNTKAYQIYNKLKERMIKFSVPYNLFYKENSVLYTNKLLELMGGPTSTERRIIAPHTMDAFSAFITLTSLLPIDKAHFEPNANLIKIYPDIAKVKELFSKTDKAPTLIDKMLLYQGATDLSLYSIDELKNQPRYSADELKLMLNNVGVIANEYNNRNNTPLIYDGCFGLDPRKGKAYLSELLRTTAPGECLTVPDVIEMIRKQIVAEAPYDTISLRDELKAAGVPSLSNSIDLLTMVEKQYKRIIDKDIKASLKELSSPREENMVKLMKYITNSLNDPTYLGALPKPWSIPSENGKVITVEGWGYPDDKSEVVNLAFVEKMESEDLQEYYRNHPKPLKPFREELANKANSLSMKIINENLSSEKIKEEMESTFGDILNSMQKYQQEKNKEFLEQFKVDVESFLDNPERFKRQRDTSKEMEKRVKRVEEALKFLDNKGYPKESIPKLLRWIYPSSVL